MVSRRRCASYIFSFLAKWILTSGPIAGGFLAEKQGWRWPLGLIAIMAGTVSIITMLITPETYAPFILRCRAQALSRMTARIYVSRINVGKLPMTFSQELSIALTRPWILLFREPLVLLTSLYVAIIYGTLYMFFAGFPIVFQYTRGWSQGVAGLPFVGVAIGVCLATLVAGIDNKRYVRLCEEIDGRGGTVEPEARLGIAMAGSFVVPIGLFLFAWTTYPSVHWIVPVIGAVFFSCGLVMVFISLMSYLVDSCKFYKLIREILDQRTCLLTCRYRLCCFCYGGQLSGSVLIWHCLSLVYHPDVREARKSMGELRSCIPRSCVCTFPVSFPPIWFADTQQVQVFSRSSKHVGNDESSPRHHDCR